MSKLKLWWAAMSADMKIIIGAFLIIAGISLLLWTVDTSKPGYTFQSDGLSLLLMALACIVIICAALWFNKRSVGK